MKEKLSPWCKEAQIKMIEQDLDFDDIAKRTGLTRTYVSSVIRGRMFTAAARAKIGKVLGIDQSDAPITL